MASLTLILQALGYDDLPETSNPTIQGINRRISMLNMPVDNDETQKFQIAPGDVVSVVDGSRITGASDTSYDLTSSPIAPDTYRLAWNGDGTTPAFRTKRTVESGGKTFQLTLNQNLSMTVYVGVEGGLFGDVEVSDTVFIPGVSTGDGAGPFDVLNEGSWVVLANDGDTLTLARDPSEVFQGVSEEIDVSADSEFLAFSSDGVQVGDTVDISAEFAAATQRSFDISAVTDSWIEFKSTSPLGEEAGIVPGVDGLSIYHDAKSFVLIETDQDLVVRYNGDTGSTNRVEPRLAGDPAWRGFDVKLGTVWKLDILNRSNVKAKVSVASAE